MHKLLLRILFEQHLHSSVVSYWSSIALILLEGRLVKKIIILMGSITFVQNFCKKVAIE